MKPVSKAEETEVRFQRVLVKTIEDFFMVETGYEPHMNGGDAIRVPPDAAQSEIQFRLQNTRFGVEIKYTLIDGR